MKTPSKIKPLYNLKEPTSDSKTVLVEFPLTPLIYQLDDRSMQFMVKTLSEFVYHASLKFVKGQLEHGGFIADRPMLPEITPEIIDLMFYTAGAKWRKANKKKDI